MNIADEITYVSTDEQRQVISWVRMKSRNGAGREFHLEGARLSPGDISSREPRRMDCVHFGRNWTREEN